jgi:hypothetical protein
MRSKRGGESGAQLGSTLRRTLLLIVRLTLVCIGFFFRIVLPQSHGVLLSQLKKKQLKEDRLDLALLISSSMNFSSSHLC